MAQGLCRGDPLARIPFESAMDEVKKDWIFDAARFGDGLGGWWSDVSSRFDWFVEDVASIVEEVIESCCLVNHVLGWKPSQLHDPPQLLVLIMTAKQRLPCDQLDNYASERPHIDSCVIASS